MVVAITTSAAFLCNPGVATLEPESGDAILKIVVEGVGVRVLRFTYTDKSRPHVRLAALDHVRGLVDQRWERNGWSVTPQSFEPIEFTFFVQEDVYHEIDVVEQDPFAQSKTFDVGRFSLSLAGQLAFDTFDDRRDLSVGGSVADDERIRDVGEPGQIDGDHVFGFTIAGGFNAKKDRVMRFGFQGWTPLAYKSWR
jgi:hypothetical protein